MSFAEILILSFALSIDAFVVSFSYGLLPLKNPLKEQSLLALFTGFFQAFMPVAGYFLTSIAYKRISPFANLIVCIIFLALGIKFITEAFDKKEKEKLCVGIMCLFLIGISTSIDALAAGITLELSGNGILKPALLIGLITFINSALGFSIGKSIRKLPVKYMQIIAGLLLIFLGINSMQ